MDMNLTGRFMTAEEALKYKLIDHVIENMQLAE